MTVALIDYGAGNLHSVHNALKAARARDLLITADPDAVARAERIDRDRIYLTGLSMGGFGTWALALRHPERYAAILPVCGGGERQLARRLREMPIWAFHGDADQVVPVERSQEMIDAIKKLGGPPRFTAYPGVGHDSWTATYDNPEVYEWLLAQRRGGKLTADLR